MKRHSDERWSRLRSVGDNALVRMREIVDRVAVVVGCAVGASWCLRCDVDGMVLAACWLLLLAASAASVEREESM